MAGWQTTWAESFLLPIPHHAGNMQTEGSILTSIERWQGAKKCFSAVFPLEWGMTWDMKPENRSLRAFFNFLVL